MKEILAIVEDPLGNVVALNTATGDLPLSKTDRCHRSAFDAKADKIITRLGGDAALFRKPKELKE